VGAYLAFGVRGTLFGIATPSPPYPVPVFFPSTFGVLRVSFLFCRWSTVEARPLRARTPPPDQWSDVWITPLLIPDELAPPAVVAAKIPHGERPPLPAGPLPKTAATAHPRRRRRGQPAAAAAAAATRL